MSGKIADFFAKDHHRLDDLLNRAAKGANEFDPAIYTQFRLGILKHIKMEETIMFLTIQKYSPNPPLSMMAKLRLDHGAITALMVPPLSSTIILALRFILAQHNVLEEESGGVYDLCDRLSPDIIEELLQKIKNTTDVPMLPHRQESFIIEATRRALHRSGYKYDDFEVCTLDSTFMRQPFIQTKLKEN